MKKSQALSTQSFGEFFRAKRISQGLTLRAFCKRYGYDPGNISRLERDILPPSLEDDKLAGYARALAIKKNAGEWVKFYDLAHAAKGQIPKDIMEKSESNNYLPLLFRTARGEKLSRKKLKELIKLLNQA